MTTHFHMVPRLRMSGSLPPLLPCAFIVNVGAALLSYRLYEVSQFLVVCFSSRYVCVEHAIVNKGFKLQVRDLAALFTVFRCAVCYHSCL